MKLKTNKNNWNKKSALPFLLAVPLQEVEEEVPENDSEKMDEIIKCIRFVSWYLHNIHKTKNKKQKYSVEPIFLHFP